MTHTRLWLSATIIACIILAGFALSVPRARDGALPPEVPAVPEAVPAVTVHDVLRKGTHTITGSLEAPNACTTILAEASLVKGEFIMIRISMPQDSGVCLQEKSVINFTTTLAAPDILPIRSTVNGIAATTTEK
jgi:hypothetical protein